MVRLPPGFRIAIVSETTSLNLLDRLRETPDDASWKRLVELYTPLIQTWLRRHSVPQQDADDLVQEALLVVVRELPRFRHQEHRGSFRSWLRAITVNRLRAYWRSRQPPPVATGDSDVAKTLDELEDPRSQLSALWDQEHDRHVARRLMDLIQPEFQSSTWQAFRRLVLDGQRAADVAAELGISSNAVLIAKFRVLRRLRQEAQGLVD